MTKTNNFLKEIVLHDLMNVTVTKKSCWNLETEKCQGKFYSK